MNYNVLVVDDDTGIRSLLEGLLEEEGYNVAAARNGQEALELLRTRKGLGPHVILLDLMMPILDGYKVLEALATDHQLRDSHAVVVMSALHRLDASPFPLANARLSKPFAVDEVLDTISRLIHRMAHPTQAEDIQSSSTSEPAC